MKKEENIVWISENLGFFNQVEIERECISKIDSTFFFGFHFEIPAFTSRDLKFDSINSLIQDDYKQLLDETLQSNELDSSFFRNISFECFLHDSLLTVLIEDRIMYWMSESTSSFGVYHFNMLKNTRLSTLEVLNIFGLSQVPVLSAFAEQCVMPPENIDPLFDPDWFDSVKWKEINNLKILMDKDDRLLVIYPLIENGIEAKCILRNY